MASHQVLLPLLICILLFQLQKAEAAISTASLKDCKTRCGNIDIPYPFGVKKGCYLDESFEIACNDSTRSASLVDLYQKDVDEISVSSHSLRIYQRALSLQFNKSGESDYGNGFFWDLGNNFFISHNKNRFVAMGCDFYAYLVDDETKDLLGGCATLCNQDDVVPSPSSTCSGLNCCQMSFLRDVRTESSLVVDTINTGRKSWKCGVFAFVDKNFPLSKIKANFTSCEVDHTLPVILEWTVGNTSCKEEEGREEYACGKYTYCVNSTDPGMGYRCKCKDGFTGNPYLYDGCQDVDECRNQDDKKCPGQNLCVNTQGSYYCVPNRRRILGLLIALGTGISIGILSLVAIGLWMWRKLKKMNDRKRKQRCFKRNGGLLLQQHISSSRTSALPKVTLFKIEELKKATDQFNISRVLGKGGLGTVYIGMLSDGTRVAVKKANMIDDSQVGQFINEVFILSQISHRHIVKLFGCCLEAEVPLLVYEYVSNGTLSNHIHDEANASVLTWEVRLRIAAEIAGAIAYLHSYASTAIYHRDIKSTNILLDEKYRAVVSDFGLSRSVSIDRTHLTTFVGGTFGYLDPEYFRSGQLNDKSDVYAFGVVLAEILTGQKAVSSVKDDIGLALRFRSAVKENCLLEILDKVVADEGDKDEVLAVAKLAKRCMKLNARKRPSMKEVEAELDQVRKRRKESILDEPHSKREECYSDSGVDSEAEVIKPYPN